MIDSLLPTLARRQSRPEPVEPLESRIAPALVVTVSDGAANTTPGSTLTYTIDYANAGEDDAIGVVLTDTLPTGTTFDPEENPGWALDAGVLSFDVGDLAAGADGQASLILHVAAVAPAGLENIVNTVSIARAGAEEPEATASDTTALDAAPDLVLTKSDELEQVRRGQTLTYTLDYANAGTQDASSVFITDALPAGTSFDAEANPGWVLDGATLTFLIGDLAAGADGVVTLVLRVDDDAPPTLTQIVNTAVIGDDGASGEDLTPMDNVASDVDELLAPLDLVLNKSNGVEVVAPGAVLTYTFDYANVGGIGATGVVLTDVLPAGTIFDAEANPGWVLDGMTLTFLVGDLAAGGTGSATLVLTVVGTAPAGLEQITNAASIADDGTNGADATPANNFSSVTIALDAAPDLVLTKSDGRESVLRGKTLIYTFIFANVGTQDASGVVLTDVLPEGATFDAEANPGWIFDSDSGTLTFAVGELAAGGQGTAVLVLTVATELPEELTSITNVATIADDGAGGADLNPDDNTATDIDTIVSAVDLTLTKTTLVESILPGGSIEFTFTYGNAGDLDATGVFIIDVLPAGTSFDPEANPGWVLDGATLTFAIGGLGAGVQGSATLVLNVAATAPAGLEQIVNSAAIVDDGENGPDFHPADNVAAVTIALDAAPDLALSKSGGDVTVVPGGTLTYTFTFANVGNQDASGVVLTDVLPLGTVFDAALNPGWSLDGSTLTFVIGGVAASENGSATLVLTLASSAPAGLTQIVNAATISDDGAGGADATLANNTATATNPLNAQFDLTISLASAGASVTPGSALAYTLTYSNVGNQTATGVVLTETLPAGTAFNAAASTAGWVQTAPGVFQFAIGSLDGGTSGSVIFAVTVNSPAPAGLEQIVGTATIGSDGVDPTPANNTAQLSKTLNAAPNLALTLTASKNRIVTGKTVTYTITYTNTGTQNASGVVLTEVLPRGLSFVSSGSSAGWTSVGAGIFQFNVGSLAVGQSVTVSFVAKAANILHVAKLANRVAISDDGTSGPDADAGNNSARLALPVHIDPFSAGIVAKADNAVVEIYSRSTGGLLYKLRPYGHDAEHVRVALGDLNGDGIKDIITSCEKGAGNIRAFDGRTGARIRIGGKSELKPFGDFGAYIAAADINGDGIADIIAGEGKGGGAVRIYNGATGALMSSFNPFGKSDAGIRVSVRDVNGDGIADILTRKHHGDTVRAYSLAGLPFGSAPRWILSYKG